jgi:hypothetical protein
MRAREWRRLRGVALRDLTWCVTVVSLMLARARVFLGDDCVGANDGVFGGVIVSACVYVCAICRLTGTSRDVERGY